MKSDDERQAEDSLGAALRRAIAEMPAPDVDLAPAILARIRNQPSALTVALQLGVLAVLGCVAATLLPGRELELRWPDLSAALELSAHALSLLQAALA